jgi:bacterioferritin-associated ferredoxin
MRTGCGACCGSCVEVATQLLEEIHPAASLELPVLSQAA